MRILLTILLLSLTACLCGQRDMVYRRGVAISISYDLEREKAGNYTLYYPRDGGEITSPPHSPYRAVLITAGDTLVYHPVKEAGFARGEPGRASPRSGIQLRLEKKLKSGFEFGGGLYYSKGWYDTAPGAIDTEATDYAFYARRIDYLFYGLTGQLKFDFFRNHRLQPSIGLQSLFLNEQSRISAHRAIFPAYETEVFTNPAGPLVRTEPANSFILELRITAALTYPLTERILVAAHVHLLSATKHPVGGLQLKYRLTDY